jgi:hypothetical protein
VRGLDILKLHLFVLHNTYTMSFPLFRSRFLRYNKHYIGTIIQADLLPPPRTLIMDFTLTHTCYGRSNLHPIGQLTHTRRSDPIVFIPLAVDTSGRIYDDFLRILFLYAHRESSVLTNELPEGSDQFRLEIDPEFRFLRATCLTNLKGSVGVLLPKDSAMRISIPIDLSSRPFIPLPWFIRSRCQTPLLTVTELRSTKLHQRLVKNGVILR